MKKFFTFFFNFPGHFNSIVYLIVKTVIMNLFLIMRVLAILTIPGLIWILYDRIIKEKTDKDEKPN